MNIKIHINLNKLHYFLKPTKKIEYFQFEEDFVEENVRCIPMIVRFKMDAVGI
ncbi:nitrate reductase associated protein, partial [Hydrotalea sp.]|uniref:nitrate reductase associated protein n=1 Tax=Hydrotalea sp. TaxID=2881279 RepID=UPI003390601F